MIISTDNFKNAEIEKMEQLIKIKEAEIKKLKEELKEAKQKDTLAQACKNQMVMLRGNGTISAWKKSVAFDKNAWRDIRKVCEHIFNRKYAIKALAENKSEYDYTRGKNKYGLLDPGDKKRAAAMADELIAIWNKYYVQIYNDEFIEKYIAK